MPDQNEPLRQPELPTRNGTVGFHMESKRSATGPPVNRNCPRNCRRRAYSDHATVATAPWEGRCREDSPVRRPADINATRPGRGVRGGVE